MTEQQEKPRIAPKSDLALNEAFRLMAEEGRLDENACTLTLEVGLTAEGSVMDMSVRKSQWRGPGSYAAKEEQAIPRPCPSCAWKGYDITHDPNCFYGQNYSNHTTNDGWKIHCNKCNFQTTWWHSREEAISQWNTRPDYDALKAVAERMADSARSMLTRNDFWECAKNCGCGIPGEIDTVEDALAAYDALVKK